MDCNVTGDPHPPLPASDSDSWGGDTDWSMIRKAAGRDDSLERDRAWVRLVERYRAPVLRSVRRIVRDEFGSEEATDEFFTYLFQRRVLPKAQRGQGRFRCYVQGVVRRYALQVRRARATNAEDVDEIEIPVVADDSIIERDEELAWSEAVLAHALDRLRHATGRDADLLCRYYGIHGRTPTSGADLAKIMGLSPNTLNVALHRARERLHESILAELRLIVCDAPSLNLEFDALVDRLLEAHPGLIPARDRITDK